jgi:hypothetical protein
MRKNLPPSEVLLYYPLAAPPYTQHFIGSILGQTVLLLAQSVAKIAKSFQSFLIQG